ncbi:MAG: OsmC family protein [Pseudomonadota bacterium]
MAAVEYRIEVERIDEQGSVARTDTTELVLDTAKGGRDDALAPPELLLASLGACMVRGIQRVRPLVGFELEGATIALHAVRRDDPPGIESIDYDIAIRGDADEDQLELIHTNLRRFSTIYNTIAAGTHLDGVVRRAEGG